MTGKRKPDNSFYQRIIRCFREAWKPAIKSSLWLLEITLPVSLLVTLLNYYGIITAIAVFLNPFFKVIGLPGQSGIVLISSIFLNIYSAIAAMNALPFTMREMTILALMCLIAHNLITETIVQRKTGTSAIWMVVLRIGASSIAGIFLNWVLPASLSLRLNTPLAAADVSGLMEVMKNWAWSSTMLAIKILLIVNGLLLLQKILAEFNLIDRMAKTVSPLLKAMGLPARTAFLWIIGNSIGLMYGSAVLIETTDRGGFSKTEVDLLNCHLGISHALLEDTLLFVAIGVPFVWILFPRIFLAVAAVWMVRIFLNKRKACFFGNKPV